MAEDLFTGTSGTDLDTHDANWTETSGGNMDVGLNGSGEATLQTNWAEENVYYDSSDETECTLTVNNFAGTASGSYISPAVLCSADQEYAVRFIEDGTNVSGASVRRNGTWIGTLSFTAQGDAVGSVELGAKYEDDGGNTLIRGYIDGVDVGSITDSSASKFSTGDGSGMVLYGGGTGSGILIDAWRDSIAAPATGVTLVMDDAAQSQAADNVALTQGYQLTAQDVAQSQAADNVALSQSYSLTVQDVSQGQQADNTVLVQGYVLSLQDVSQSQLADALGLSQASSLVIDHVIQSQSVDAVVLASGNSLALEDADQGQVADAIALTQGHILALLDVVQTQNADNVGLSFATVLVLADVQQDQVADALTLQAGDQLTIQDVAQAQITDNLDLLQGNILAVDDIMQNQVVDAISLFEGDLKIAPGRMYIATARKQYYQAPATDRTYEVDS